MLLSALPEGIGSSGKTGSSLQDVMASFCESVVNHISTVIISMPFNVLVPECLSFQFQSKASCLRGP